MSFVANFVTGVVDAVVGTVVDIVTFDIEGLVDRAVATVEGIVHTITHPTEDPMATIMLAFAVYSGYQSFTSAATAEAAILSEAAAASAAASEAALAAGMTAQQAAAAGTAASNALITASGATAAGGTIAASTAPWQAVSGPMFDAAHFGAQQGMAFAQGSTALASAGVAVAGGMGAMGTSSWATTAEGALRGAPAVFDATMAGPSLSLAPGTYGGVGAGSAAGSMVGWGGGPTITGISTGNVFLEDLKSVWTDSTDFTAEVEVDMSTDWAESESAWGDNFAEVIDDAVEAGKTKVRNFYDDTVKEVKNFSDDPLQWGKDLIEEAARAEHPFISGGKIPTTTQEFFDLGVDMA